MAANRRTSRDFCETIRPVVTDTSRDHRTDDQERFSALGFTLDPANAALVLTDELFFDWLSVGRLSLDLSALAIDPAEDGPPERFQRRRTRLEDFDLRLSQDHIERYIEGSRERLAAAGIEDLTATCQNGYLSVAARVTDGRNTADATCRLYLAHRELALVVLVAEARVYGYLPTPMPAVAHRLCAALLDIETAEKQRERAAGAFYPKVLGLGQFEVAPLSAILWNTMAPAGWRLPSTANVALTRVELTWDGIEISYRRRDAAKSTDKSADAPPVGLADTAALQAAYQQLQDADNTLLDGDIDGALRKYRGELAAGGPEQPHVIERILGVESAHPAYFTEAADFARQTLARYPDYATAHAVLANLAAVQGDPRSAGTHYQQLVELAEHDQDNAVRAALAGARILRTSQPEIATVLYERVLEYLPSDLESSAALVDRYQAEGRFKDLVRLLRERVADAPDKRTRADERLRLAQVLSERLGDADGALQQLQQAAYLTPDNSNVFDALASHHIHGGKLPKAIEALDKVVELSEKSGERRTQLRALLSIAALHLRMDQPERAEARYLAAIELDERDPDALAGAAAAAVARDDHDAAIQLWHRVLALGDHAPRVVARYQLELGRSLISAGRQDEAVTALKEATRQGRGDIAGEAYSLLARMHRDEDQGQAVEELDAAVQELTRAAESIFAQTATELVPGVRAPTGPIIVPQDDGLPPSAVGTDYQEGKRYLGRAAQLAIERAELLDHIGRADDAHKDYERAHSLARDSHPSTARQAARALFDADTKRGDRDGQKRWLDALLATQPKTTERIRLLLSRAQLRADDPEQSDGALRDLGAVIDQTQDRADRSVALGLQARLLSRSGDREGEARSLMRRAELTGSLSERAIAECDVADAWLRAEDTGEAMAAAVRALDALARADADGVEVPDDVRRRALESAGDLAWRRRIWKQVVQAYGSLRALAGSLKEIDEAERVGYAYRLGIGLEALGEQERALESFAEVVQFKAAPSDIRTSAWRSLGKLYERTGELLQAAFTFESLASDMRASADAEVRADAWYRAGELYHRAGEHLADARRCTREALAINEHHMRALDTLERIETEQENHDELASVLSRKVTAANGQPSRQKALLVRLATVQHDLLDDPELARSTYDRALQLDADFRPALRFIAADELARDHLLVAARMYQHLSRALPGDAALPEDEDELLAERVGYLEVLASIAERSEASAERQQLSALAREAIDELAQVASENPVLAESRRALELLRTSDEAESADSAPAAADPSDVATAPAADQTDETAAATITGSTTAVSAAELRERADLAAERGDFTAYAEHLEALVSAMATPGTGARSRHRSRRAEAYLELADLYYDHLGDRERARRAMLAAAEAYGAGSRHDATLRMLAAEAVADHADDIAVQAYEGIEVARQSPADRYNLAASYQRLGMDHRALAVLEDARASEQLTDQAARLLFRTRQEIESKAERARTLEARAESAPAARATDFLREALELYEEALGDTANAARLQAWLDELARQPEEAAGPDTQEVDAAVVERELVDDYLGEAASDHPGDTVVDASEASTIIGNLVLQRPTEAERIAATTTAPGLGLPRLWKKRAGERQAAADSDAAAAPRPSTPQDRLEQLIEAALDAGDGADAAEQLARAIVHRVEKQGERETEDGVAGDQITRHAIERLRAIAEEAGAYEALVRGLGAAAKAEPDPALASAWWAEVSLIQRDQLGSRFRGAEALSHAIVAAPENADLIAEAAALFPELGDHPRLIDAYELHAQTLEGVELSRVLAEIGRIHLEELQDTERADEYYTAAYHTEPLLLDLWSPLAELRAYHGDYESALALYNGLMQHAELDEEALAACQSRVSQLEQAWASAAEASDTVAQDGVASYADYAGQVADGAWRDGDAADSEISLRIDDELSSAELMGQGAMLESHGRWDAAIEVYERAAVKRPNDLLPLEAIARIYNDLGEGEALLEVLDRLAERARDPRERARVYFRQAEICRDFLRRDTDSYHYLRRAFEAYPDDVDIAYALRVSSMARGEWTVATQLIEREIATLEDPRELGALHLELALIHDEKLLDARSACENYERALELDPEIPAAPRPLARIYELEGRLADAAAMHERAAMALDDLEQRALLLRRAAECAERAGDIETARRLYGVVESSAHDDPTRAEATHALDRLAGASGDEVVDELQREIANLQRRLEAATTERDREQAEMLAYRLLELEPANLAAFTALEANAEASGDWPLLAALISDRANAVVTPDETAAAYFELGSLNERRLHDTEAAIEAYENALRALPNHPAALEALASVAFARRDWGRARALYGRMRADRSSITEEILAYRRGVISEGLGNDREALAAFSRAAELAPDNPEVLTAMTRVALRTGNFDAAITAALAQLELLPVDDVQAINEARLELAQLYSRTGNLDQAMHYNEQVLAENPRHQPAMRALYTLYLERRKFEDAAGILGTIISMTNSLARRAELLYNLGELYRSQMNDPNRAADAYLKGIDLNPEHPPTLRRLIDYYWREDEPGELLDMVAMLREQGALLEPDTDEQVIARSLLTAAGQGRTELVDDIAGFLDARLQPALLDALIASSSWEGDGPPVQALAEAVLAVCERRPEIELPQVIEELAERGAGDGTPRLVAALRTMHSIRSRMQ